MKYVNEIEIKSSTASHFVDKQGSFLRLLLTVTIVFLCHALEQNNDSYWAPIQLDTKLGSSKLSNEQAFITEELQYSFPFPFM